MDKKQASDKAPKPRYKRPKGLTRKERKRIQQQQREAYRALVKEQAAATGESPLNRFSRLIHEFFVHGLSNLRFSLSLRIAATYARLLLGMYFRNVTLLLLVFCIWQAPQLMLRNGKVVEAVIAAENPLALPPLPYAEQVVAEALPGDPPAPVGFWQQRVQPHLGALRGVTLAQVYHPVLHFETLYAHGGQTWRVRTAHDLWPLCVMFLQLMAALLVFDIGRAVAFLFEGRRMNRKTLQPIADMSKSAQMLSENDLSLRLNVAGAKSELRDLASVLNDMLDRVEVAYNGQKQFVSDASHELRTPIAVIQGYANLLERWGKDDPQVRDEAITAIVHETANMKELVEKLLFLARHDKQPFALKLEHFELRELMEETIRETEMITANHHVETGALTSGILYADRNAIKQAIRILIDNAVKYTPAGGTIRIGCERQQGTVTIAISDTGAGIATADLPNIFDRFYRADAARAGQTSGHGLGLSIAKIIVLAHGGKIKVRSQKGKGTTFSMVLPN